MVVSTTFIMGLEQSSVDRTAQPPVAMLESITPDAKAIYFQMKGREVYDFAVSKGTEVIQLLLENTNMPVESVKCFICHQANVNIILQIAENLGVPEEKFYMNMFRYGNTASASVPIALDEAIKRGIVTVGDSIITAAFGGGLSWGANLIQL